VSGNVQKVWFNSSLNGTATKRALDAIQLVGKSLPVEVVSVDPSGTIVTVKFALDAAPFTIPQVTVPVAAPEFIRYPIAAGAKGVVVAMDARIGSICGLGSGTATLAQPANIASLVFLAVGSKDLDATDDPRAVVIYGPNGVVLRTSDGSVGVTVDAGGVTIDAADSEVTGNLTVDGNLSAGNGITCSFTTPTGQTVTVQDGIVTNLF
jgi:hypothetical protein